MRLGFNLLYLGRGEFTQRVGGLPTSASASCIPNRGHFLFPDADADARMIGLALRATSHTRLRARDLYASSTLIGGKRGVDPSSLHTTLEGPTEYVNARWM